MYISNLAPLLFLETIAHIKFGDNCYLSLKIIHCNLYRCLCILQIIVNNVIKAYSLKELCYKPKGHMFDTPQGVIFF
jgi:hypothetical protein